MRAPTREEQNADPIYGLPGLRGGQREDPASLVRTESGGSALVPLKGSYQHPGEGAIVGELQSWYLAAATARKPHEAPWRDGLQFFLGNQWGEWGGSTWVDSRDPSDPDKRYLAWNKIKPIARRLIARSLALRAEVTCAPQTSGKRDVACARIARGLISSFEREMNDAVLKLRAIERAVIVGPVWSMEIWDGTRMAPVPDWSAPEGDPSREMLGAKFERRGGIRSILLSCLQVYPDPRCEFWEDVRDVVVRRRMPVSEVQRLYPDVAARIKPGQGTIGAEMEIQFDQITNDGTGKQGMIGKESVDLLMRFTLPGNPLRPEGMFAVWTENGVLCQPVEPYPYEMRNDAGEYELPVTPLCWEEGIETLYGSNALCQLVPVQRTRNRLLTSVDEHARSGDGKLLAERGSNIDPLAFKSGRKNEVIYWDGPADGGASTPPHFIQQPPQDPSVGQLLGLLDADMAQIAEVTTADEGNAPYPNASAETIQQLQEASTSTISLFRERLSDWLKVRMRKRICLARQFFPDEGFVFRMDVPPHSVAAETLGKMVPPAEAAPAPEQAGLPAEVQELVDQYGQEAIQESDPSLLSPASPQAPPPPEDQAAMEVQNFRDFKAGRVVLSVSSSVPRSPGAKMQTIVEMARAGMFVPEVLPITILMLEQMELVESSKFVEDLMIALKAVQARQEQMQQQQAALQMQQQQAAAQAQMATRAVDHDAKMEQMDAQAQIDQQSAAAQAQAESEAQAAAQAQQDAILSQVAGGSGEDNEVPADEYAP